MWLKAYYVFGRRKTDKLYATTCQYLEDPEAKALTYHLTLFQDIWERNENNRH